MLVPAVLSFYDYSYWQTLLAMVLLGVCLYPAARHVARREQGLPVLPVLCVAYAAQFAAPVFTQNQTVLLVSGLEYLEDAHIISALLLSILGVCILQVAYYSFRSSKLERSVPTVNLHLNKGRAIAYAVVVGVVFPLANRFLTLIPEQGYQQFSAVIWLLNNQTLVAIFILGWVVYSGQGAQWHKGLLYLVVTLAVINGASSGMLEQGVVPLVVLFIARWRYTGRWSVPTVTVILALILFLQPAKGDFRNAILKDAQSPSAVQVWSPGLVYQWVESAALHWVEVFNGEKDIIESTSQVTSRFDLIHQFAHIYRLTPAAVPYRYGGTYSYFLVAFIPRAVWPEKPSATSANDYFAVAYGLTTEEGLETTSIGASLIGEGYMNFGLLGVVLIMALQGIVLRMLQHAFAGRSSGPGGEAIFLAIFVFFLNGIGSSAAMMFGGILQNLLCNCVLLWWAREKPGRELPAAAGHAVPALYR
jgi:hypothetical protein